jgi:hypothetical protein
MFRFSAEVYGALCPQINNTKLRIIRQFSDGKIVGHKEAVYWLRLFVHEMYLVCV